MEEMHEKEENRRLKYAAEEERIKADGSSGRKYVPKGLQKIA